MSEDKNLYLVKKCSPTEFIGPIEGLYGRMPVELKRVIRKMVDAPDYDYAAMELMDAFNIEWRIPE